MTVAGLTGIDWTAPWWAGWSESGQAVQRLVDRGLSVSEALNAQEAAPVRFIPQADLPQGQAYESHIFATSGVPTRDGAHDFLNGLCWMRFPLVKRQLNRLQAEAIIAAGGVQSTRGALRDALTLMDENGALLQAPEPVWQALLARDWIRLFVKLRPLWAQARLVLFGHAMLEKLVQPYKSITAHVLRLPLPPGLPEPDWDAWLAGQLTVESMHTKPFTPLPVLGVPGWWPANEAPGFYADPDVFRVPRHAPATGAA